MIRGRASTASMEPLATSSTTPACSRIDRGRGSIPARRRAGWPPAAITRMLREPASTREKMSRPFVSVPNGYDQVGERLRGNWLSKMGLVRHRLAREDGDRIQNPMMTRPTITLVERRSNRKRSDRAVRASDAPHRRASGSGPCAHSAFPPKRMRGSDRRRAGPRSGSRRGRRCRSRRPAVSRGRSLSRAALVGPIPRVVEEHLDDDEAADQYPYRRDDRVVGSNA